MRKFFIFLVFLPFLILNSQFFIPSALAQSDFTTRFTSTYDVSSEGVAKVTHHIELTNRLSQVFASEYSLTIGSTRIKDISAQSPSGVETSITNNQNSTLIVLKFANPVIGKNQTHRFSVSYTNLDIATKSGRVLEVNIPKMSNAGEVEDYAVVIKVPDSYDAPSLMTPVTKSISHLNGQQILRYNKNQLAGKGVSILFGDHQVYDFTLRYTLSNPSISTVTTVIAIPPDTPYQKIYYQNLDPLPKNVTVDSDGNWLAEYKLPSKTTTEVRAIGQAVLYLKSTVPSISINPEAYYTPDQYWQTEDRDIVDLAQKLKTPENIYNYLVANLTYNYQRIDAGTTRLGAKSALENPQNSICTEFTDLFVALARAAGIPARANDGFAFTANSKLRPLSLKVDVLHAWPEYYNQDTRQWVPVDPTWGNTTGGIDYFNRWDLNHFTFAIHGQNSSTPYPAGAYKLESTNGKDVNVAFSLNKPQEISNIQVEFAPASAIMGFGNPLLSVFTKNTGNTARYSLPLQINAPGYNSKAENEISILPPYATHTTKVELTPKPGSTNQTVTAIIEGKKYDYNLSTTYTNLAFLTPAAIIGIVAAIISVAAYFSWNIFVRGKR